MKILKDEDIARISLISLICEVSASPKPGLVDLINNGSHRDMNYMTFIKSAFAISDYFKEAYRFGEENISIDILRKRGIYYENKMYEITEGVNTHKGAIFSMGFIAYSAGILNRRGEELSPLNISKEVKIQCKNISEELKFEKFNTQGQAQFVKYGLKGARGEAEEGFIKAIEIGLFHLKRCLKNLDLNDSLVETLMYFLREVDDSNTIKRTSLCGLKYVKNSANTAIELGAMHTQKGRNYIKNLDVDFINRNISPGGCADYLIITLFFYFLEELNG